MYLKDTKIIVSGFFTSNTSLKEAQSLRLTQEHIETTEFQSLKIRGRPSLILRSLIIRQNRAHQRFLVLQLCDSLSLYMHKHRASVHENIS